MYTIRVETNIVAPSDRCFDLARSVDAHVASTAASRERVVGGRMSGLLTLGEEVTWEAKHFGVRQRLTSRITKFDRPNAFQDRMTRGAFAEFEHDHLFHPQPDGSTTMVDLLRFRAHSAHWDGWPNESYSVGICGDFWPSAASHSKN